jgi:hypothetical protein
VIRRTKIDTKELLSRDADEGVACGPNEVMLDREELEALCAAYDRLAAIKPNVIAEQVRLSAERAVAMRKAIAVIMEARAWIAPKNLDPDHHHYDPRAVAFAERCRLALDACAAVGVSDPTPYPETMGDA